MAIARHEGREPQWESMNGPGMISSSASSRCSGRREATTLMEHLPPVGWADVATKRDLDALKHELRAEFGQQLNLQTRTMIHAMILTTTSSVLTVAALAFAAGTFA